MGTGDGWYVSSPTLIPFQTSSTEHDPIVNLSTGGTHTVLITKRGTVYAFGDNDEGQLGTGDLKKRLVPTLIQ